MGKEASMIGLLVLADAENINIVLHACRTKKALISRKHNKQTERYLLYVWQTGFGRLQEAIVEHIELSRKIYLKHDVDGKVLEGYMQANVMLYSDFNIYVEMRVMLGSIVILAAHGHYTTPLPQ